MTTLIKKENGTDVIWIDNGEGEVIGIASSCQLLELHGDCMWPFPHGDVVTELSDAGFDIVNDFDNECWILRLDNAVITGRVDCVDVSQID